MAGVEGLEPSACWFEANDFGPNVDSNPQKTNRLGPSGHRSEPEPLRNPGMMTLWINRMKRTVGGNKTAEETSHRVG